jgi:hypothetical protein
VQESTIPTQALTIVLAWSKPEPDANCDPSNLPAKVLSLSLTMNSTVCHSFKGIAEEGEPIWVPKAAALRIKVRSVSKVIHPASALAEDKKSTIVVEASGAVAM